MFPLAFVAGWLQGHWWGFISRNYVVWPTIFLMNVFIALKGSHFWFYILCQHWQERLTDDYHVLFYFGVRVEVKDAMKEFSFGVRWKLEIFPLGSGSWSRMQSHWTYCMILVLVCKHAWVFFCVQADAFCTWRNAVAKAGRETKSPEIAKLTTQSIVFFKGRINEIFVNY